jgi:hypothetical protein
MLEEAKQDARRRRRNKMHEESEFTSCLFAGVKGVKGLPHVSRFFDGGESSTASNGPVVTTH